ncbi:hypothetical protein [Gloeobacter morelensis]|uniref:Uncharacterized protein n=1 Tax=Gloeobacter morelensis MG652769 TaxID=2781736 RepID=A0ABY3PMN6_9CYAN|nr:hypothetical protein [Gloeobacter morelensis]UFP94958.1 hypothetical protein ISF26_01535 [Gloeobacter morelensis MG652769]
MIVSTFELLVKNQLPKLGDLSPTPPSLPPGVANLSRTVIQGYFLTIANLNPQDLTISLVFTANLKPPLTLADILAALDINGENIIGDLIQTVIANKARFTFTLPANATSLLIVQPDFIEKPELLVNADFEVRGYVEIFISSLSSLVASADLQVTPEHRGTFFKDLAATEPEKILLDQIAYALPVPNGGSLRLIA